MIDLAGIYELSQQPIAGDTDTSIQVGETRQEAIRDLAQLDATRKQIALAMGGNYNDAYAIVKKTLDSATQPFAQTA